MRHQGRWTAVLMSVVLLAAMALPAAAGHEDRPRTDNLHPMGHIEEPRSMFGGLDGMTDTNTHTDIAFWGDLAFQGTWRGFNIRDISSPGRPKHISSTSCDGPQADMVVWGNLLVRTWDVPAGTTGMFSAGTTCDGTTVPIGWEGLHIFDISDVRDPRVVGSVQLPCGSHSATGVPDLANNRLVIYSSPHAPSLSDPNPPAECDGFDVVQIPLANPTAASYLGLVDANTTCHDIGVILGDTMLAACAGGAGYRLFDIGGPAGGTLDNPVLIQDVDVNVAPGVSGVTNGHSAAFSWDGEVVVFGHEPGSGLLANCQETSLDSDKSVLFFSARTGAFLGMWTLPRAQTAEENCTIHNYNVVPTRNGRNVLVVGNYQAGTWVVDFTDPARPRTLAWSDPPPEPVPPTSPLGLELGGAWSSYWYNGFIYETHITSGLNVFRFSGKETAGAIRLSHLNPQTQEFTLG